MKYRYNGMASSVADASELAFGTLSTFGTLFSTLSALWGAYFVLFILAIWATYQHDGPAQKQLRVVTVCIFVVLLAHYMGRSVTFGRARRDSQPTTQHGIWEGEAKWTVPLTFINDLTSTITGTISDGLLAWRFYVVWGRSQWALYVPSVAVCLNTMLGLAGNFLYLSFYHDAILYNERFELMAFQIHSAWAWCMLGVNTFLTGLMVWRIIHISHRTQPSCGERLPRRYYVAIEAIAESALIMWIGLVAYGIASVAPQGKITTHLDVGFITNCILPMFFGISQCLITVRLGFSGEAAQLDSERRLACSCSDSSKPAIAIMVKRETDVDASSGRQVAMDGEKANYIT